MFGFRKTEKVAPPSKREASPKVQEIWARRYPRAEKAEFLRLWYKLAELCEVVPEELGEDDVLAERCPRPSTFLPSNERMEAVEEFALRESRGKELSTDISTVGKLLDWLLST